MTAIDAFWDRFDGDQPEAMRAALAAVLPHLDPARADYERASLHDSLGEEAAAAPLYRAAIAAGLDADIRDQAIIQLASTLRNLGEFDEAIALLEHHPASTGSGDAARAFLALALHDAGRESEALAVALTALAPTLPRYQRAVRAYASELPRS